MTTVLAFYTTEQRITAAQFVAELVRQGVCFKSTTTGDNSELVITFTGGF